MKICFCLGSLNFSGAENVVRFLSEQFIGRGHEVSAVLLHEMPTPKDEIIGLHCESAVEKTNGLLGVLRRIKKERRAFKKINPDVLIVFSASNAFTAIPATLFLKNIKVIVGERIDPTVFPHKLWRRRVRDILFSMADACVSQTEKINQYFSKICKVNAVIPNPIRETREKCPDIANRKKVFATVARLDDKHKNQTMLIKAFASFLKTNPEYELHFLGDGSDLNKFKSLVSELAISDNVLFLGKVQKPLDYIKDCRAFVLSSNYEGMPNALIEAMSIGLPCISTDCIGGGAAFLIEDGVNGFLVNRGDVKEFAKRMTMLASHDEMCNELGKHAYEINQKLSSVQILELWETLFEKLLNE